MHHHHFSSLGAVVTTQPALAPTLGASERTAAAYVAVAEGALGFLDHFLLRPPHPTAWPGTAGLRSPLGTPEHLPALSRKEAQPVGRSTANHR